MPCSFPRYPDGELGRQGTREAGEPGWNVLALLVVVRNSKGNQVLELLIGDSIFYSLFFISHPFLITTLIILISIPIILISIILISIILISRPGILITRPVILITRPRTKR